MTRPVPHRGHVGIARRVLAVITGRRFPYAHLTLWAMVLISISGCPASIPVHPAETIAPPPNHHNASAFYYFSRAELMLKQGDIDEAIWLMGKAVDFDPQSTFLKLELADLYLINKTYHKALMVVNGVLEKEPDNLEALAIAGKVYQLQNKRVEAQRAFEKILANNAAGPDIYLFLGRLYWDANDMQNAGRIFGRMVKAYPESYVAHYFNGLVLSARGEDEPASSAFLKALDLEPSLNEARQRLLKIYQKRNQSEKITAMYLEIIDHNPFDYTAVLGLAEHYRRSGDSADAEKLLAETGQRAKDDEVLYKTLFDLYFETKDFTGGVWALNGLLRGAASHPDLHFWVARAYDGLSDNANALDHLKQVSYPSKFYHNAVIQRAVILHDTGRTADAVAVIQEAMRHTPDQVDYYLYLATFHEELEQYEKALDVLQQGLVLDDSNSRLHFQLGVIYDKIGRREDSIAAMKAVVRLKPDNAEALNYLGYTYADMGINLDEAETLIHTALQIKPDDGYITDSMGWLHYKRGRYREALKYLNRAVELVPDDPVILEHLGDVYRAMERPDRAIIYYQRSIEKKNKHVKTLEKKIEQLKMLQKE